MQPDRILNLLKQKLDLKDLELNAEDSPASITLETKYIKEALLILRDDKELFFDQLSCVTGLDNGPEENSIEVIYNLYSIPFDHHLMIKVVLDRSKPAIPTVSDLWKTAEWHEREAFDLLGITFTDHPDLRRILLPQDWEGHPLRKDYSLQEYYHGIKVEY